MNFVQKSFANSQFVLISTVIRAKDKVFTHVLIVQSCLQCFKIYLFSFAPIHTHHAFKWKHLNSSIRRYRPVPYGMLVTVRMQFVWNTNKFVFLLAEEFFCSRYWIYVPYDLNVCKLRKNETTKIPNHGFCDCASDVCVIRLDSCGVWSAAINDTSPRVIRTWVASENLHRSKFSCH